MLFFIAINVSAQKAEWHGILVGTDLSRLLLPVIDHSRFGWEVSGDYEIIKDVFANAEIGSQTTNLTLPNYKYSANGAYTRLGIDYNFMKHLDDQSADKLLIGLRYGFTTFAHKANNIMVEDNIWGNFENGEIKQKWLSAGWAEIASGMRAHLFNNFYLGWTVRFKLQLFLQKDENMQPYHIPGYGRAWNTSSIGFNYSLYYKIPLLKKKTSIKAKNEIDQ